METTLINRKLKSLKSVEHALDVLRDNDIDPREITGAVRQQIFDWKTQNWFPTSTYLLFKPVFERLGYEATPRLWKMRTEPYSH